jgi:hypothetical protein
VQLSSPLHKIKYVTSTCHPEKIKTNVDLKKGYACDSYPVEMFPFLEVDLDRQIHMNIDTRHVEKLQC